MRPETTKLLEENIDSKFLDIGCCQRCFESDSKRKNHKSKNKQVGLHKLKGFYTAKETINKMKGNLLNGRKYLQIMYLVSQTYKELI